MGTCSAAKRRETAGASGGDPGSAPSLTGTVTRLRTRRGPGACSGTPGRGAAFFALVNVYFLTLSQYELCCECAREAARAESARRGSPLQRPLVCNSDSAHRSTVPHPQRTPVHTHTDTLAEHFYNCWTDRGDLGAQRGCCCSRGLIIYFCIAIAEGVLFNGLFTWMLSVRRPNGHK